MRQWLNFTARTYKTVKSTRIRTLAVVLLSAYCVPGIAGQLAPGDACSREADKAITRTVAWLRMQQRENGAFGSNSPPAATAMILRGLSGITTNGDPMVMKAELFVRAFVQNARTNDTLGILNAAVCREFLSPSNPVPMSTGGIWRSHSSSYNRDHSQRARSLELNRLAWEKERADLTARGEDPERLVAKAVVGKIFSYEDNSCRIFPTNCLVVSSETSEAEGRGYGDIDYRGTLALITDDVPSLDPRVDALLDWAERHWDLDNTPRGNQTGLYFFYHGLAKCLNASGRNRILPLDGASEIKWRSALIHKLCSLQRKGSSDDLGYWQNDIATHMEDDPVLTTGYALLALRHATGFSIRATAGDHK